MCEQKAQRNKDLIRAPPSSKDGPQDGPGEGWERVAKVPIHCSSPLVLVCVLHRGCLDPQVTLKCTTSFEKAGLESV
eukprot:4368082-Amphidinium_carterae.2